MSTICWNRHKMVESSNYVSKHHFSPTWERKIEINGNLKIPPWSDLEQSHQITYAF